MFFPIKKRRWSILYNPSGFQSGVGAIFLNSFESFGRKSESEIFFEFRYENFLFL